MVVVGVVVFVVGVEVVAEDTEVDIAGVDEVDIIRITSVLCGRESFLFVMCGRFSSKIITYLNTHFALANTDVDRLLNSIV